MPRGPLPAENRRRTNAPTIPTTNLPASGRPGNPPRLPTFVHLGKAGKAWWRWAWSTPQAVAWARGHEAAVARRASLEDDLDALEFVGLDLDRLPAESDLELVVYLDHVKCVIQKLKSLAGGRLAVLREMRELDDRLGLTPKAMAALRWTIVEDEPVAEGEPDGDAQVSRLEDRRRRLTSVS